MSDTIMMSEIKLRAAAKITLCRKITRLARANHGPWDKMTIGEHGPPVPLDFPASYF